MKKTTTDVLVEFHKNYGTENTTIRRFSTRIELFEKPDLATKSTPVVVPSPAVLAAASPSKKRKKPAKTLYVCQLCGIEYNSSIDKEYGSGWIGCNYGDCDVWQHLKCMGLSLSKAIKSVKWKCSVHRQGPPRPKSVLKKSKKYKIRP